MGFAGNNAGESGLRRRSVPGDNSTVPGDTSGTDSRSETDGSSDAGSQRDGAVDEMEKPLGRLTDAEQDVLVQALASRPDSLPPPHPSWHRKLDKLGELLKRRHGDILELAWHERKGRVLHSKRDYAAGGNILSDRALLMRYEPLESECSPLWDILRNVCQEHKLPLEPLWYLTALDAAAAEDEDLAGDTTEVATAPQQQESMVSVVSVEQRPDDESDVENDPPVRRAATRAAIFACLKPPSEVASQRLSLLYRDVDLETPSDAVIAILTRLDLLDCIDPFLFEAMLETLKQNCFSCFSPDGRQGLGIWFTASFLSHSCIPNALWVASDQGKFSLVARRPIRKGDEICISYLDDESLAKPPLQRRKMLAASKGFLCRCERCEGTADVKPRFCWICGQIVYFCPEAKDAQFSRRNSACQGVVSNMMYGSFFAAHVANCILSMNRD